MNVQRTVACVIGTRPEAIKMAPVVRALRSSSWARCLVIATAQHRGLLDQMLTRLQISVDYDLGLMLDGQQPSDLMARILPNLDAVLAQELPEILLAQGDTTTVLGAALCAFHRRIPFGHVEAGLRTHDLEHPFPEEGYRQMVARIARWHFAPTEGAAKALLSEGISLDRIHVTGNTCIDTLIQTTSELGPVRPAAERLLLATIHRRENFGTPLKSIFAAMLEIAETYADIRIVYPVHPNPNVRNPAFEILGRHPRIELLEPLDYFEFVALMRNATLILTDSGGIQEEAPALGKPVLVLRDVTERPEAIAAGVARLVGTKCTDIVNAVIRLLEDDAHYLEMTRESSPYGDGKAADRILQVLSGFGKPTSRHGVVGPSPP